MFQIDRQLNYGPKVIEKFLSSLRGVETVLDVGAGDGRDLELVENNHPRAQRFAQLFFDAHAAHLASKGIKAFKVNFEKEKIPLESESMDLVISNQTLEHSKEIFWVFHELSRVLKIGGHLIIGVPNLASLHNRLLLLLGRQPTCIQNDSAHVRGYTFSDLKKVTEIFPGGFEAIGRKGSNFYPFSPAIAKPLAAMFPSLAWGMFVLFKKKRAYDQPYFLEHPRAYQLETNFFLGE